MVVSIFQSIAVLKMLETVASLRVSNKLHEKTLDAVARVYLAFQAFQNVHECFYDSMVAQGKYFVLDNTGKRNTTR